jgi:EAL domain-containing protein (putative c-di-GMP-specific phosphodiesterase class I)
MAAIRRELFSGEVLFRQGESSDCAWLIESGAIELVREPAPGEAGGRVAHGTFGPGELIGELGLLEGAPRAATATARGDTVLLAIDHEQFVERLDKCDPIVRALVGGLLRRTRNLLAALPADAPVPADDLPRDDAGERSGIDKIRLEAQLREALADGALEVRYQPIYDLVEARVSGYEALTRWDLPGRGPVSPAEFIKLAEETSLIVPVGEYVLDRVIDVLVALRDGGADPLPNIAVNLSARQLVEPGMARQIVSRIDRARLPMGALKLEVTESRMLDYDEVAKVMAHCRAHGVPFALDDFGTGYSNLTHLHKLEFEFVKVDQAFARQMFDTPKAMAIVEAIVAMAHGIGAEVVMEGVETQQQLQRLRELRVRYAQGYLTGRAQPVEAVLSGEAARVAAGI